MNEALNELLGRSTRANPERRERAAQIADLVRCELGLPERSTVTVQQLACAEPGCPPVETKIVVLGGGSSLRWTIHAPLAEVDDEAVRRVLTERDEGRDTAR
jgi:hypothetical protein